MTKPTATAQHSQQPTFPPTAQFSQQPTPAAAEQDGPDTSSTNPVVTAILDAGGAAEFTEYAATAIKDGISTIEVICGYYNDDPTLLNELMEDLQVTKRPHKRAIAHKLIELLGGNQEAIPKKCKLVECLPGDPTNVYLIAESELQNT